MNWKLSLSSNFKEKGFNVTTEVNSRRLLTMTTGIFVKQELEYFV